MGKTGSSDCAAWVLAALLAAFAGTCFGAAEGTPGLDEIKDVTIVVAGEPYTGSLLPPPTESEFRFRWAETKDVLAFRWSSLEETERRRVQKLFGIEIAETGERLVWGETLPAVRFRLTNRKTIEGYEVPERALPGYRCLKTATQVVQIPEQEIEAEDKIEKRESDLFSPEEGYDRLVVRKPPSLDSAGDHLYLAMECAKMGLYGQAIDHLEMAKTIDPRTEERTAEFRGELLLKHEESQATKLYYQIVLALNGGRYGAALDKCNTFLRNFPSAERRTKIEAMLPEITEKAQVDLTKQVIFMYYGLVNDLINLRLARRTKVDVNGRAVPVIPGKQITTRHSRIMRGTLKSESPELVEIQQGDMTIQVPRADILTMTDVDLSKAARTVNPTLAELKAYVTDAAGGIGKDVAMRISQVLSLDEAKIREIWDGRLAQTAVYEAGTLKTTPCYATLHTATYGKGSWLRDGVSLPQAQGQTNLPRRNQRTRYGAQTQTDPQNVPPEYSDDPEIWWTVQSAETKANILKAMCAEKLFKVKEVIQRPCHECAGTGVITIWSGGTTELVPCPACRGLRVTFHLLYR
jgi:tetratricopeptide (TPR) repeat protein